MRTMITNNDNNKNQEDNKRDTRKDDELAHEQEV
jgi:hypothetical protein